MKFLRDLFHWFFGGSQEPEAPPQEESSLKNVEDQRPSEQVLKDIFDSSKSETILEDLKRLEQATKRFDSARDDFVKELKNIAPQRRV